MNKSLLLKGVAVSAMLMSVFAAKADYPASSYTLSTDGKSLIKWTGSETAVDMNSDAVLAQVTSISDNAFYENREIKSIVVGNNVTSIGRWVFLGCYSLESATLPQGLTEIGIAAFSGCEALKSIALPEGMQTLSNSTFYQCTSLQTVTLPSGLTSFGSGAFSGCSSLKSIAVPAGINELSEEAFKGCAALETVQLPAAMTIIGTSAFEGCASLKNIQFPSALTEINSYAFAECGLESIDMSGIAGEVYCGYNVFDGCKQLRSAVLPGAISGGNTFFVNCSALEGIVIPDTWDSVPAKFCQYCTGLKTLDLGNVETIKNTSFFGCTSLTDIVWSENLTTIDWNVFFECTSLTSVVLPASLQTVDDYSFSGMTNLKTITIGAAATSFGANCFSDLPALTAVYCEAVNPPALGSTAFQNTDCSKATLYVPAGSEEAYKAADQWKEFATIAEIGTGVADIEAAGSLRIFADRVCFPAAVSRADLFSAAGQLVRSVNNADEMMLNGIPGGIYVLRAGEVAVRILVR